jgi:FtsP/CotA-like multicopper oxidase with cupredoxin domain
VPEFIGDTILVNGKAWPFLNVQPKRYRFLFLNGSNARTYELFLLNPATNVMGPPIYVIGTDGGYLDTPAKLDPALGGRLVIMPGERYEAIIDFAGLPAGTTLILRNSARAPYPKGTPPSGSTTGRVMQFRVSGSSVSDASYNPASGAPLRGGANAVQRLVNPATGTVTASVAKTRQLTLNEVLLPAQTAVDPVTGVTTAYPGGPVEILVNNTKWSGESPRTYGDFTPITLNGITTAYSELPREGDTEVWEIVNTTADAHPMHLHLVQFQLISRQAYHTSNYAKAYAAAFPAVPNDPVCTGGVYCPGFGPPLHYRTGNARAEGGNPDITPFLQNKPRPPRPEEAGWKDTIQVMPGEVTRIAVRWAPTSVPANASAAASYFPFDPSGSLQHGYVWHCHIVDHEDNEMMRPDVVQLNPLAPVAVDRPLVKGAAY